MILLWFYCNWKVTGNSLVKGKANLGNSKRDRASVAIIGFCLSRVEILNYFSLGNQRPHRQFFSISYNSQYSLRCVTAERFLLSCCPSRAFYRMRTPSCLYFPCNSLKFYCLLPTLNLPADLEISRRTPLIRNKTYEQGHPSHVINK